MGLNSSSTMGKLFNYHFSTQQPSVAPYCPKNGIRASYIYLKAFTVGSTLSSQPCLPLCATHPLLQPNSLSPFTCSLHAFSFPPSFLQINPLL